MKLRLGLALVVCVAFVALAPQQVAVDWLPGTEFSRFKTYIWRLSPQPVRDVTWNGRIISNVDAQLSAKGLKKVGPDGNPDLVVLYIAGKTPSINLTPDSPSGGIQKVEQNEASLKVYLEDPRLPGVVWCALGTDALADTSDKNLSKLEKLVQEMFKNYPPAK
jgi:hypothetical protein